MCCFYHLDKFVEFQSGEAHRRDALEAAEPTGWKQLIFIAEVLMMT